MTLDSKKLETPAEVIRPWYREPWPWFLFGIPGLTVVASMVTLYLALSHPNQVISAMTVDNKKQMYRSLTARDRGIEGQLAFNENGKLYAAFTAKTPFTDKAISVQLYEIRNLNNGRPSATANDGKNNVSRRHSSGMQILALELSRQEDGSYQSATALSLAQRNVNYWLEVVGERSAWSLSGTLPAGGKALLQPE